MEIPSSVQQVKRLTMAGLDIEAMKWNIENAHRYAGQAKDKDIILVIGNTGAGKSTLINYLCDVPLKKVVAADGVDKIFQLDHYRYYSSHHQKYAPMGDGVDSKTFYTEIYTHNSTGFGGFSSHTFNYCDCPGFIDNRTEEERICTSINTQLTMKMARSVRSILVVIDFSSFKTDRAKSIRALAKTLNQIVKDFETLGGSILFVITKAPTAKKEGLMTLVGDIIKQEQKNYAKLTKNSESAVSGDVKLQKKLLDQKGKINVLKLMESFPENIFILDIEDKGLVRKAIEAKLSGMGILEKARFDFGKSDNTRIKFTQVLEETYADGIKLLNELKQAKFQVESCLRDMTTSTQASDIEKQMQQVIAKIDSGGDNKSLSEDIKKIEQHLQKLKTNSTDYDAQIKKINDDLKKEKEEKEKIDSVEDVVIFEDSYKQQKGNWTWHQHIFGYSAGVKISRVDQKADGGKFYDEIRADDKGIYSVVFKSDYWSPCSATVKLYAKKRDNYKTLIQTKLSTIDRLEKELETLQEQKGKTDSEIKVIESILAIYKRYETEGDQKKLILQDLQATNTQLVALTKNRLRLQQELEVAKKCLNEALDAIEKNKSLIEAVIEISLKLNSDSVFFQQFYNMWLEYKSSPISITDYNQKLYSSVNELDEPGSLGKSGLYVATSSSQTKWDLQEEKFKQSDSQDKDSAQLDEHSSDKKIEDKLQEALDRIKQLEEENRLLQKKIAEGERKITDLLKGQADLVRTREAQIEALEQEKQALQALVADNLASPVAKLKDDHVTAPPPPPPPAVKKDNRITKQLLTFMNNKDKEVASVPEAGVASVSTSSISTSDNEKKPSLRTTMLDEVRLFKRGTLNKVNITAVESGLAKKNSDEKKSDEIKPLSISDILVRAMDSRRVGMRLDSKGGQYFIHEYDPDDDWEDDQEDDQSNSSSATSPKPSK